MRYEDVKVGPGLIAYDITGELWREYEWGHWQSRTVYRIDNPVAVVIGHTTHRVIDSEGIVHCVPNVGRLGCVVRWAKKEGEPNVLF